MNLNNLVMPVILRFKLFRVTDISGVLLNLVSMGTISFVAAAQFAPSAIGACSGNAPA